MCINSFFYLWVTVIFHYLITKAVACFSFQSADCWKYLLIKAMTIFKFTIQTNLFEKF